MRHVYLGNLLDDEQNNPLTPSDVACGRWVGHCRSGHCLPGPAGISADVATTTASGYYNLRYAPFGRTARVC